MELQDVVSFRLLLAMSQMLLSLGGRARSSSLNRNHVFRKMLSSMSQRWMSSTGSAFTTGPYVEWNDNVVTSLQTPIESLGYDGFPLFHDLIEENFDQFGDVRP